jgi:hypothetical protein
VERPNANRRQHFRLTYPPDAGPLLVVRGAEIRVLELSERGLRLTPSAGGPTAGERLEGVLRFPDGVEIPIEGVTLRAAGAPVTIRLVAGVGLDRMLVEQRRILRDYPDFLRR